LEDLTKSELIVVLELIRDEQDKCDFDQQHSSYQEDINIIEAKLTKVLKDD
jgi:hypothetical protein